MTTEPDRLELAKRCEKAKDIGEIDRLCRELHAIDPHSNVNGTCADYLRDIHEAKRLIPEGHGFVIYSDVNRVRADIVSIGTDRKVGFSALRPGPFAETKALCAAALRASEKSHD